MITANELRVGNWIFDDGDEQKAFQIEQICKDSDGFKGYYIVYRNGSIKSVVEDGIVEPIPLTAEIVAKAGLRVYDIDREQGYGEAPFVHLRPGTGEHAYVMGTHVDDHDSLNYTTAPVRWLHQLQNVHFAWCGEELPITL